VETAAQEITRLKTLLIQLTSHYTGQEPDRIAIDMQRDFYMDAPTAIEYGIVDQVRPLDGMAEVRSVVRKHDKEPVPSA